MRNKYIAVAAMIIILLTGLAGCGETTNFLGGTAEEEIETVRSDEVYIPIEKVRTLNPVITKDEDAYYVDRLVYESLFGYDRNLALTDILADSYTFAEDRSSVTINVKQGIYWQDGKEFTAEDVKFTMDVIASASYSNSTLYVSNISNVKYTKLNSKDPYQITIYFNNPQNVSLTALTFPIIPKHQFKNIDAAKKPDSNFIPVGTGAYRVAEYNGLSHIILTGYESYHGGNPPTNRLNFRIIPEKRDAVNLMDVNNISITFSKDIDRDTIYTNKEVHVVNFPSNEAEFIGFNFRNTVLKDGRVRKAIAGAINTAEIIESAYYKNGVQNDTIFFPNFLGISSVKSHNLHDISKSKELLREAGYYDRNGDGRLENAAGTTLSVSILVNAEDQSRIAAAQIIKEGLEQLTIHVQIVNKDWNSYNADLAAGNYDIFLGGYQFKENYDLRFLLHTGYGNLAGYSNPTLDALLDQMESGISQKDRQAVFDQVKDILIDELPYYCLLYKTYGAIASPGLQGELRPTFLNLYQDADTWYSMLEVSPEPEEEAEEE
jgi:peptide/nickel transport system substrate-binding protein